jgi:hypothetical protein
MDHGKYTNISQSHECGNWDCGRPVPFLGIYVSNSRYWFYEVYCVHQLTSQGFSREFLGSFLAGTRGLEKKKRVFF